MNRPENFPLPLFEAITAIIGPKMEEWLKTPNDAFGNDTPMELIERGDHELIWRMIEQCKANVAN